MELYCLDLGKKLLFAWVGAWSLSNKSFSSVTAYLVYWVIVTNTLVVFHNQIFVRSEHRTSSFRGTSGGILSTKLASFQQTVYRPFGRFPSLTFTTMARSSLAHALKFNFISGFSHSSIHWTAGCQLAPINFLFIVGFNQFQFVTELVEEILVNITCALLMMEATTSETSLMLVCYDIS